MSLVKSEDGKKWINAFMAIIGAISGYVSIRFLAQMSEWFDLEARVNHFELLSQGVGILIGVGIFLGVFKHKAAIGHLREVYDELVKVIWPDKDSVVKVTVGIIIGLSIVSSIFVAIDFSFQKILDLIY